MTTNAQLATILSRAALAADTRKHAMPVLSCVRITVNDGGRATALCTDMELAIEETFDWPGVAPLDVCVPVKPLLAYVKSLPKHETATLDVFAPSEHFEVSDFPSLVMGELPCSLTVPATSLQATLARVAPAICTEETRKYLCGVHLEHEGGQLLATAVDGHRLHHDRADVGGDVYQSIIVPHATVTALIKLLAKQTGDAKVKTSDARISVTCASTCVISKLVDGTFPEYRRVMPSRDGSKVGVNIASLLTAVKQCKAAGADSVVLDITPESAHVEVPGKLRVLVAAGCPLTLRIRFNPKYLLDTFGQLRGDTATMWLTDAQAPIRIEDGSEFIGVIMPKRI